MPFSTITQPTMLFSTETTKQTMQFWLKQHNKQCSFDWNNTTNNVVSRNNIANNAILDYNTTNNAILDWNNTTNNAVLTETTQQTMQFWLKQ